ncbi:MAG: DUF58 domain-containing protein [Fimbriimonas sp.]|nr:DUF58 domain-containing protein [Fimbriimonas sp.]
MSQLAPSQTSVSISKGNAVAFLASFLWVVAGFAAPTKSPFAIVSMAMGCLLFGWFFVATLIGHLTSESGIVCEEPLIVGEVHALLGIPIAVRLDNPNARWPILFLSVELLVSSDGSLLRSPPLLLGTLPSMSVGEFNWHVTLRKRGEAQIHGIEATTTFPGSLIVRRFFFPFDLRLAVLPAMYRLKPNVDHLLQGYRQAMGHQPARPTSMEEFVGVRDYRPGDNPRNVCLALSTRMPDFPWQLVVREFADTQDDEVCVVLDTLVIPESGEKRQQALYRLEKAVSFAIALCRRLCERKHAVRFLACQPEGETIDIRLQNPARDIPNLERRLARLTTIQNRQRIDRILLRRREVSDAILLFVCLDDEPFDTRQYRGAALRIPPEWQASFVAGVESS